MTTAAATTLLTKGIVGLIWLAIIWLLTGEQFVFAVRILFNIVVAIRSKRSLQPVVAATPCCGSADDGDDTAEESDDDEAAVKENATTWEEPSETLSFDNNNNKIIWGFWHSGEETLPGFCQLAVKSWRAHHPDWKIVILSDANYKHYVSPSDLPSTFASLKVQYRSDLIRLAVLRRYGGLYLDASYTIYRAFDDVWDQAEARNDLYLTSLVTLSQSGELRFPNNCFILAPQPQNPVLVEWQRRCIAYLEDPCLTTAAAPQHPQFQRVAHHFSDPALGALSYLTAYFGVIWTLADVLYYEAPLRDYVADHVWILPSFRWSFDHVMIQNLTLPDKHILHGESYDEGLWSWITRLPNALRIMFGNEPAVAQRMLEFGVAMKTSSDFYPHFHQPIEFHTQRPASVGLIYRAAVDKQVFPVRQADTIGARRVVPIVEAAEEATTTTVVRR